jgi:hypothetical protein
MGMFDYLRCKYPLPVAGANALEFQTKDTDSQYLDWYEISEDGWLLHEDYDIEDKSDKSAPEGSLSRLQGCMSQVNKRWEKCENFTGEVAFYTSVGKNGWVEFSAYFVKGQLKHLETIEHRQPTETAP